jgi:hypothetical protein
MLVSPVPVHRSWPRYLRLSHCHTELTETFGAQCHAHQKVFMTFTRDVLTHSACLCPRVTWLLSVGLRREWHHLDLHSHFSDTKTLYIAIWLSCQAFEHHLHNLSCCAPLCEWEQFNKLQTQKILGMLLPQLNDLIGKAYPFYFLPRWLSWPSPQQGRRSLCEMSAPC